MEPFAPVMDESACLSAVAVIPARRDKSSRQERDDYKGNDVTLRKALRNRTVLVFIHRAREETPNVGLRHREGWTWLIHKMPYEPLPASVLFGLGCWYGIARS